MSKRKILEDERRTFLEHLEELRRRFIICLVSVSIASLISYFFSKEILLILKKPLNSSLVFLSPQEAFLTTLKISIFSGAILSLPILIYQLWQFIHSALTQLEKKYLLIYGPFSFLLFIIGLAFGYFFVLPLGFKFLLSFGKGILEPMISIDRYISFVIVFILIFGIIFELPLVSVFLTKLGIIDPNFLRRRRRQAIVLIFVISAILTPPDVLTQIFMAIPLILLFELSILISQIVSRRPRLIG